MAPAGAILISLTGPKLLERETNLPTHTTSKAPGVGLEGGDRETAETEKLTVEE